MTKSWIASLLLSVAVASAATVPEFGSLRRRAPSPDVITNNFVPMRTVHSSQSKGLRRREWNGGTASITNRNAMQYVATVTWGDEQFDMLLDTGSSDTWVLQEGYQCLDSKGAPTNKSHCPNAPNFSGNYTGGRIENVHFNLTYGTGSVIGTYGWEDITIAGVTVHNAQVASATKAYFPVRGISGIFGLAFSSVTSEWPGDDPSKDSGDMYMNYEPVFYRMVRQKLSLPTFSFAPERNGSNGYLAFGGIPPVNTTGKTGSTAILSTQVTGTKPAIDRNDYYTINVDGVTITNRSTRTSNPNSTHFPSFQPIVDTGNTLTLVPSDLAAAIAGSFNPPATFIKDDNLYEVPCNATAPKLDFAIGGVNFTMSPADLIMQTLKDSETQMCPVGVQSGGGQLGYILGGTFLNNVLSTYDLGALEVRFTALAPNTFN
ncbi:aspartic peptidase domain-containing protein [Aspergillus pseudotamarii]|uniref:Aspartic peptidase domain-containing protein n=1 Tax=Aspergillus pseudotamarii TaxID=132259 RepID=A0A5N6TB81_ASPPS|nr:aspartic peptidase domain-containing protein [Aspergillus pseudotamarii]KAE8143530.1 aspartic peptidase domain-containing protein [Aspergillus pseudotamarii]